MVINPEELHIEHRRDTYWARIHFESDDSIKKATVLICASRNYLWDLFRARKPEEVHLEKWFNSVIDKWKNIGDRVLNKPIHYDVYANTREGQINGLKFLKEEVVP